jgi:Mycothiol maleylpyruvate isomerase N-terminal domain
MTTQQQWTAIRKSLEQVGADFAGLALAVDPAKMATRHWSVADTVAHVTTIAGLDLPLVQGEQELSIPELNAEWLDVTIDTVKDFNALALGVLSERKIDVLAEQLVTLIGGLLQATADADPDAAVTWLGDSRLPIAGLLAHLTNELLIHGRDIARATKQPWTIRAEDAAQFFDAFVVGLFRNSVGKLVDDSPPAPDRRIAVAFTSDYTTPVTIAIDHGVVRIEEPGPDNDVRLFFDPATLNLSLFGRVSRARATVTGGMRISGPRIWLLPEFLRTVRMPS